MPKKTDKTVEELSAQINDLTAAVSDLTVTVSSQAEQICNLTATVETLKAANKKTVSKRIYAVGAVIGTVFSLYTLTPLAVDLTKEVVTELTQPEPTVASFLRDRLILNHPQATASSPFSSNLNYEIGDTGPIYYEITS